MKKKSDDLQIFYPDLLDHAPVLIWRSGTNAKCDWFNAAWLAFTGRKMEQEIGDGWAEGVHKDDLDRCVKIYLNSFAARRPFEMQYRLRHHDGQYRWIVDYGVPFNSVKGEFAGFIGYCFDITDRKISEEAVRKSEERFKTLFMSIGEGFYISEVIYDEKGSPCDYRYIEVNPKFEQIIGLKRDQIIGKRYKELVPVDTTNWLEIYFEVASTGKPLTFEFYSDEYKKYFATYSYRPIEGQVIVFVLDITERKHAEEILYESEKKYRELIDGMIETVWVMDFDGNLIDVNSTASKVLGYSKKELLSIGLYGIDSALKRENIKTLAGAMPIDKTQVIETTHKTKDGKLFPVEVSSSLVTYQGKKAILSIARDITERKRVEGALRRSEAQLDALMDFIPALILIKDHESRFIYVNENFQKLFQAQDWMGKKPSELFPPDVADLMIQKDKEAMEKGYTDYEETRMDREGNQRILYTQKFKISIPGAHPLLGGIISDITDRKRAEYKIIKSNRTYAVLSNINHLIFRERDRKKLFDEACKIVVKDGKFMMSWIGLVNEESGNVEPVAFAGKINGYLDSLQISNKDSMQGRGPTGTALREGRYVLCNDIANDSRMLPWRDKALATGYHSSAAFPLRIAGKTIGAINFYSGEVNFFDDEEVYLLDELTMNISYALESRQTESLRERAEEELRETRDYLDNLLSFANAPIMVWDSDFNITRFNMAFERLTGYSMYEVISKHAGMLFPDTSRESLSALLSRSSAGEHLVSFEIPIQCKNGSIRTILWNTAGIYTSDDKKIIATIAHGIDMTEYKHAEEERSKLQVELMQAQKMDSLGTLAGGIAHDFNNILGIILGYSTLLGNKKEISGQISDSISAINQAVQRGASLVRQILTFARKTSIVFDPVSISDLIYEIISMLRQTFPKIITFKEIVDPCLPYVHIDRTQIYQAILNLCINARDAMPGGGCITIKAEKIDGEQVQERFPKASQASYICVSVVDTGEGMDKETCARAFDPFFTTKPKDKGTGIGLSVVYGAMQVHNGFVDVESSIGKGSVFHLYFPLKNTEEPRINVLSENESDIISGTETILLVEDEEFLLEMMSFLLQSNGYTVYTAKDGLEVVDIYKLHKNEIALVLTDLGLPGITGTEVVKKLKAINPDARIICASGYFEPEMKLELESCRVNGFIQKPYMPDEILKMIRDTLDMNKK